jgi:V/A-type H+-transporting ATPase subunit E
MSIESITDRIRNEAKAYSDDQKAQAEAAKKEALDDARREADGIKEKLKKDAEHDAAVLKDRRKSVADLDARKMQLGAKQDVIAECYDKALDKLLTMEPDDYISFLKKQLAGFGDDEGEVILNAADKEKYGDRLAKELDGTSLSVSDDTADIKGGCILRRGSISYNASIEKLLDDVKAEMTSELAGVLFK